MKLPAELIPDGGDRHKAFVIGFDDSAKFDGEPEITITVVGKCGFSAVDIRDEIVQLWSKEHEKMCYFVAYERRPKTGNTLPVVKNIILREIHPVVWAANKSGTYFENVIYFWSGIPEDVAAEAIAQNWYPIEGE